MATEDPTAEQWRPIPGYETLYAVSTLGRVMAFPREFTTGPGRKCLRTTKQRIVKPNPSRGYLRAFLYDISGVGKFMLIHRAVLSAFARLPAAGEQANHKNFDRSDNRVANLEWVTAVENMRHLNANKPRNLARGSRHGRSKLSESQVREMRCKFSRGADAAQLSAEYGVTFSHIHCIMRREKWAHVT